VAHRRSSALNPAPALPLDSARRLLSVAAPQDEDSMRIVLAAAAIAALSFGCSSVRDTSNQPDSGVDCSQMPADAGGIEHGVPAGSGTITGGFSFSVGSSYEEHDTTMTDRFKLPDGGTPPPLVGSYVSIILWGAAVPCVDSGDGGSSSDGGFPPWAWIILVDPQHDAYCGRRLPGEARWRAGRDRLCDRPSDAGYQFGKSTAGAVHLSSSLVCSLRGSFDVTLQLDGDAGTLPLQGSFDSPYCN